MHNKLQELTDKLYNEGLSKGKEAGEEILAQSKKQAEEIIAKAKEEAKSIKEKAEQEANDFKLKIENEVKMAASQALQATKKDIENLIIANISDSKVSQEMKDTAFVKELITEIAKHFNTDEAKDLEFILPAKLQSDLEPYITSELSKVLSKEISASFSKQLSSGFKIGPKDGSYYISLTEESFKDLISGYMREKTKKILFGE